MPQSQLTLVSHALCPFVQRAAIALLEKGVSFQRIDINLRDRPDWFLALSPTGKVPLLRVSTVDEGEVALFESVAICEYLEEVYPAPALHPADAVTRARHRAWIEFATAALGDAWMFLNAKDQQTAHDKSEALRAKLERFDSEMSDGPYFAGDSLSMVDIAMAPVFRYFDLLDFQPDHRIFDGLIRVAHWRRALAKHPNVQAAVVGDYADRLRAHLQEVGAVRAC